MIEVITSKAIGLNVPPLYSTHTLSQEEGTVIPPSTYDIRIMILKEITVRGAPYFLLGKYRLTNGAMMHIAYARLKVFSSL